MSNTIHPTAILEGNIELGTGNVIGPNVVIRGEVRIGHNNNIGAGVHIENNVVIGNDNTIYAYATIGSLGEMGLKGDSFVPHGNVVIGSKVTIREFVCIHSPYYSTETRIHDQVYLMNKSYVAHDVVIGQGSVLSAGVLLGGRVVIEEGVTIGMGSTVHQRMHIGAYAMIGMQTPVTRPVLPFSTIAGNPARIIGFNRKGAERLDFENAWLVEMESFFQKDINNLAVSHNLMILQVEAFLQHHPDALVQVRKVNTLHD